MIVIWITGLAGSGKTTLANALKAKFQERNRFVIQLDGDAVRATISSDLSYTAEDRLTHINRIQNLAKLIVRQGAIVIVSALYFDSDISEWNKNNFDNYCEVYIDASLEFLKKRDQKNIYSRFIDQKITNVVGLDVPYDAPANPDFVFRADDLIDPDLMSAKILEAVWNRMNNAH